MAETPTLETIALGRGWLTPEQIDECRAIQKKIIDAGVDSSLEEVLLKKTYLTKQQLSALNGLLGKGVKGSIEGYEILEKIAQGGMGAVYRAKQTSMTRLVAIKVLLPKFLRDPDAVERFTREARAVASLSHPNIVSGIDAGVSNGIYYYVMEFLDGESMEKVVARRGSLPWTEAVAIIRQVASALDHAHQHGLVHRDIKPSNIFLLKDGTVKLTDLGLARLAAGEDVNVTQSGTILGTPGFISPEQARGDKTLDIRSDLYSLGLTFFEFLAGTPPYEGDNAFAMIEQHCTKDVPVDRLRDIPKGVAAIVAKMSARDRARRYQTPAALIADLDVVLKGGQIAAPEPAKKTARKVAPIIVQAPQRSSAPWIIAGVAAALLVIVLLVRGATVPPEPEPPKKTPPVVVAPPPPPKEVPKEPPKETPKPPDSKLSEKELEALSAYKFAQRFESDNPDNLEEARDLFVKAAVQGAGTPVHELASTHAQEIERLIDARMQEALKSLDVQMRAHESSSRFGASREAALKAVSQFRAAKWQAQCTARAKEARERARQALQALLAKADALFGERDFASASASLAVTLGIEDFDLELVHRREEIDRAGGAGPAAKRDLELDDAALKDAMPKIVQTVRARDYVTAVDATQKLVDVLRTRAARERVVVYREWLAATVNFQQEARDRFVQCAKGEKATFELRGGKRMEGTVKSVAADAVVFDDNRTVAFQDLTVACRLQLLQASKNDNLDPRGPALLATYEGEVALADRALEAITQAGIRVPVVLMEAWQALHDRPDDPVVKQREKDAEKLLGDAEGALRAKKLDDANTKLDKLVGDFATTAFVKKNDKRIKAALALLPREIVLYAAEAPLVPREWQLSDDKEAAAGKTLLAAARRQFPQSPSGAPSIDFKFTALKEVKYILWLRQRRGADAATQNAVWLTIPDAVGADGAAWPAVMLQFFTGQGNRDTPPRGWTAHDQFREPRRDLATLQFTFKTTGEKTLRIACCEDGTGFDQIVISAEKYLKSPPDVEIVPKAKK